MKNQQQNELKEDIKKIDQPGKTLPFEDKSSNMYGLTKEHQHQHIKRQTATSRKDLTLKGNKLWKIIENSQLLQRFTQLEQFEP